jgi:hypothetical protein
LNDGEARSRENPRIATCYDKRACVGIRRDNRYGAIADVLSASIPYYSVSRKQIGLVRPALAILSIW